VTTQRYPRAHEQQPQMEQDDFGYMANVPLDVFGLGGLLADDNTKELASSTDNYSLSSLKVRLSV